MDDRVESRSLAALEPVSGRMAGGAFRRLPILPVVALVAFFFGLSVGFALAPKSTEPAPTSAPSAMPSLPYAAATFTPAPIASLEPIALPPGGGVTMAQAIAAVKAALPIDESQIVSVNLVDEIVTYSDRPPERWVWEIVMSGTVVVPCQVDDLMGSPAASDTCSYLGRSVVYVDYYSGQVLREGQP